jgi:NADPH:quinone reductase-like Zn-dependent oxidoreductase
MKVFEIRNDWGLNNLLPGTRPMPEPGPREVLLRMRAATLNYRDRVVVEGNYGKLAGDLPLIPLSDGVGEVVAVGSETTRFGEGDRVCTTVFQAWQSGELREWMATSALGGPLDGVLCEYRALCEDGLVRAPEHLSDEEAAALPCAGLTAWDAVVTQGAVKPGETVLILGTGGVALFALQFAKLSGATVIITSKSDEKLQKASALGADHTINYVDDPEWGRTARDLAGGEGVDLVVETGGGKTLVQSLRAVRTGGRISLMGVLSGATLDARVYHLVLRRVRLQGITLASRDDFDAMNRAIALHRIHPIIDRVFPFEDCHEAFRHLSGQHHFGKVAISIG